ncbi:AAA domain-containing protein [Agromyces sp. CF514]|uniref:AAA family ATPase n=1 Tax=Agromyces sp. CF514 TaxID=1881031 RepID=UPI0008F04F66|nr:AAA family ATPase [Agromyces sp. CF514]SFR71070.1 AAA domain-containing protein [Agromyces sp. CF514]
MRIVVSGTHASGKTTLIDDLVAAHPEFERWGDPFELVDDALDEPDASTFFEQLVSSARRLMTDAGGRTVVAERGPIDFLAYLGALEALRRGGRSSSLSARGFEVTASAMQRVDLLVVLPLHHRDDLPVGDDEDPELRAAMDEALLELVDDPDLVGEHVRVIEVSGDRATRLAAVERALQG